MNFTKLENYVKLILKAMEVRVVDQTTPMRTLRKTGLGLFVLQPVGRSGMTSCYQHSICLNRNIKTHGGKPISFPRLALRIGTASS